MIRRARSIAVLTLLLAGAIGTLGSTQTWIHVALADGAAADIEVAGAAALPVLAPLSLAVLALGAALSIVGPVVRMLLGALTVAAAVGLAAVVFPVLGGAPIGTYAPSVTETTGIAGEASVADLVAGTTLTAWPAVTAVAVVVLALGGLFVLVTGLRWQSGGRKYDTAARRAAADPSAPLDAIDSWDDLTRGDDPTTPEPPR